MSTRLKALGMLGAAAILITACGSSGGGTAAPSAAAPSAAPSAAASAAPSASAASEKIKVTLLTKATGGFWDAMIAGAKKYETDHPNDIELTTNACKTNDDTPCQIAEIQDAVTKGAQAIVVSPMGVGVTDALNEAQQAGVKIVFVDNTIPGVVPDAVAATNNVKGGEAAGAYIKSQLKSGDTIGLLEAVRGVPNLDQRIDGVKAALDGTGVKVVIGGQQTLCDTKNGASVTQDLLTKYPNLTAIYSACDSPAMGAVAVAESKQHPLLIFGYDGDPEMAKLIQGGKTTATMAQSPFKMTNLGVEAAVKSLKGENYVKAIDTGTTLVTKDNAADFTSAWQ
ncbi:MAG: sugar ABC transporter substrate-binding protein [Chloroflexota bacterium]